MIACNISSKTGLSEDEGTEFPQKFPSTFCSHDDENEDEEEEDNDNDDDIHSVMSDS